MAIIVERLNNSEVKVTCESKIDETFWNNIKYELNHKEAIINSLRHQVNTQAKELSYLKKESK